MVVVVSCILLAGCSTSTDDGQPEGPAEGTVVYSTPINDGGSLHLQASNDPFDREIRTCRTLEIAGSYTVKGLNASISWDSSGPGPEWDVLKLELLRGASQEPLVAEGRSPLFLETADWNATVGDMLGVRVSRADANDLEWLDPSGMDVQLAQHFTRTSQVRNALDVEERWSDSCGSPEGSTSNNSLNPTPRNRHT